MVGRYPVEGTFHLSVGTFHAALTIRIIFCLYLDDIAILIFRATSAHHDIGIFQTNLFAWSHTEEFLWSILHEVITLNPKILAEGNGMCAISFVFRIVYGYHLFRHILRIIGDHQFYRVHHGGYSA